VPPERFAFSKSKIEALRPHPTKRLHFKDTSVAGLGLRLQPSGHRSFNWFRKVAGQPTFKLIGTFPQVSVEQARKIASDFNSKLNTWQASSFDGPDPFQRRVRVTLGQTFEHYCTAHLQQHAKNPDSAVKAAKWLFERHLAGWKGRSLASLPRPDVASLHREIGEKHGHYAANRVLQLLRAVVNFAIDAEMWSGQNPCSRIPLFHEASRERFLQPTEFPKFLKALSQTTNLDLKDFTLLALLTGVRRGNLLAARWEEIDFERGLWLIPDTKNREPHVVPLVHRAVEILAARRQRLAESLAKESKKSSVTVAVEDLRIESGWVFPGTSACGHVLDFKTSWRSLLKEAGIENFRVHDARRTLAAYAAGENVSLHIVSAMLGHKARGVTSVYARLATEPVKTAIDKAVGAMFSAGKKKQKLLGAPRG
jgi:integrase